MKQLFSIKKFKIILLFLFAPLVATSQAFITTWKTDNPGTSLTDQITIHTTGAGYSYNIYWEEVGFPANNGTEPAGQTGDYTITFPSVGSYRVEITGTFPRIFFNFGGDRSKILTVEQWGNNPWSSMGSAFYGCANLTVPAIDAPDLSLVTDMSYMFSDAYNLTGNIGGWDVSNVTNMSHLFGENYALNQSLNSWDVSSVTDMSSMFINAFTFDGDVSSWNVSSVTDMSSTFDGADVFNQDIGSWNVANVTTMSSMFEAASSFNQNIGGWNVSNVTNMSSMFRSATSFNQNIGSWDVSNVIDMSSMFWSATSFNQNIGTWVVSNVTNMENLFRSTNSFNQDISLWDVSKVTNMIAMFRASNATNLLIDGWDVSSVTDMSNMFNGSDFNQPLNSWNVSNVTNMSGMFANTNFFNQNIGSWDVSSVTDMNAMFLDGFVFNQDISGWDVSSVTDMSGMFDIASDFDQNLGSWDVSSVTDMSSMFADAGLSIFNYDQTLIGWQALASLQSGVTLGANNLEYCTGEAARLALIGGNGWTITGDALNCVLIGGVVDTDYNALVALYNATTGASWLTNTEWLSANPVSTWFGVSTSGNRVIQVDLNDNNLVGTLPPEIGYLTGVLNFRLRGNSISGTIPPETGNMTSLSQLWFYQNQLTGVIPTELGNLTQLTELRLDDNQLTGSIPSELGDIPGLWLMYLYTNQLTGSIPITSVNFTSLTDLDLKNNMLSGTLPTAIGDHTIITTLLLGDNQLSGAIPSELGNLTSLIYLQLHNNQFTGSIPVELGNLSSALHFYLYNNQLTGSIPIELGSLSSVIGLRLHLNQLTGSIPVELGNLSTLLTLELYSNQLTGPIPMELGNLANLTSLRLFSNQLNGTIPAELGNLSSILDFRLEDNLLTGSIPSELGNLSTMTDLRLHTNQLSGSIPPELGNLTNLTILYIYINQLSGAIPAELGTMTNLSSLFLFSNQLDGTIPVELGNLSNLTSFRFDDNLLSGAVPTEMTSLTNLTNLVFHNNQLNNLPDFSAIIGISQFTIEDNNFEFDDIEPNVGISGFTYSPQGLVPGPGNLAVATGDPVTISITVGGSMNQYQWVKDGVDMIGETIDNLNIASVTSADAGTYFLRITSSLVPGLTLQSEDIILSVDAAEINVYQGTDSSGIPITDGQVIAVDFGSAVVGTDIDQTFAIENPGISTVNISSISLTGDPEFSVVGVSPTSVDPGATVTFGIRLNGTGVGAFNGTVLIDNDIGIFDFPVSGTITLTPEPEISVYTGPDNTGTPISDGQIIATDIGSSPQGTDLDQVFAIENTGTADLNISAITSSTTAFSLQTPLPAPISPGATDNFTLRLSGASEGIFNALITIDNDDTDEPAFGFPITGAIEATEIVIHEGPDTSSPVIENGQPDSVDVGTTPQGTDLDKEFVISNTGSSDLNILSITTDQPAVFSILNPPSTIAPGSFAEFLIRLNAQQPGVYGANVTISSDGGDITFPVTGEVLLLAGDPPITVYNAVTPNGDDRHDFLRIENIEAYPDNMVTIYSKLGKIVVEIRNYNNSDSEKRFEGFGNLSDSNSLTEGTYYYIINFTNTGGEENQLSGFFVLGR